MQNNSLQTRRALGTLRYPRYLVGPLLLALLSCSAAMRRDATTAGDSESDGRRARAGIVRSAEERPAAARSNDGRSPAKPAQTRMVLYSGKLAITTPSVLESRNEVERIAQQLGGYIQSARGGRDDSTGEVVIRVPAKRFDEAVEKLSQVGRLSAREIKAKDVTREFSDLQARLELAKTTRARLYALLKRTGNVQEKIKILREIRRLSETIESMNASSKGLLDRANFATITVALIRMTTANLSGFERSPFGWVRRLGTSPSMEPARYFTISKPAGFYDYQADYAKGKRPQIFLSPDGVRIRLGRVKNEPRATQEFWVQTIEREMKGRAYETQAHGPSKQGRLFVWKLEQNGRTVYYALLLLVRGEQVLCAEAVFPTEDVYRQRSAAVFATLESFQPRQIGFFEEVLTWIGL